MRHDDFLDDFRERPLVDEQCLLKAVGLSCNTALEIGGLRLSRCGRYPLVGVWNIPPVYWRFVEDQELLDVVVIHPQNPAKFQCATGLGEMLGEHHLDDARWPSLAKRRDRSKEIKVYRYPLTWLWGGCDGVCPLNPWRFASDVSWNPEWTLNGEDAEHNEWLRRLLDRVSRVPVPRVRAA